MRCSPGEKAIKKEITTNRKIAESLDWPCTTTVKVGRPFSGHRKSHMKKIVAMPYNVVWRLRLPHQSCRFSLAIQLFLLIEAIVFGIDAYAQHNHTQRSLTNNIECLEDIARFYRDPNRPVHKIWTSSECSKYYLCLEGEVFNFKCSEGLLFDVVRQICDFKQNVDNCDVTAETPAPKPLLDEADCPDNQWACGDATCLPNEYFCDGSVDCPDESDEGWCDADNDPNAAELCDPKHCKLPDCFCSKDGTIIPGRLEPHMVPQMILLTFDDAVNFENWELFTKVLFSGQRRNPNGCPIKATFFVSHPYTNYQYIQKLWNDGHEIAVHSVTHRGPEMWWSHNATIEDWFDEMVGQANILNRFASVRMEEIRGMRVPFLRVGWNRQFLMMKEFGFAYDSSMVAPFSNPPLWPYTMDYKMPHVCMGNKQNCPSRSYPGIWEMVLNQLEAGDYTCAMIDSCPPHLNGEDIYRMLTHNFKRHYLSNRAPLGLYFHAAWFKKSEYLNAFMKFVDDLQKLPDVYFVTNQEAIQWMRNPTSNNLLYQFEPWSCKAKKHLEPNEKVCNHPNICKLRSRVLQQDRYLYTCKECPPQYPWIRNEFGLD
ncbi:chitin deacetylase 1 [Stomoxys calcitrans]|uniref:chitin deacetylase 1 n=1 Tax=Stomoxys calcitrans TaxID=35570 RepID=UPI0027E3958E|nr:chitin deacetylase 1 [Stomoxys calcitrans]